MNTDTDMWLAFARTFGMLLVVLALFLVAFYLFRRFSAHAGSKGNNLIQVLAMHHISPKEKLILVNVLDETILIGVTPQSISSLAQLGEKNPEVLSGNSSVRPGFAELLKRSLKSTSGPVQAEDAGRPARAGEGD